MKLEILIAVNINIVILCDIMQFILLDIYQSFEKTCCFPKGRWTVIRLTALSSVTITG
jgi:hypothetical protein